MFGWLCFGDLFWSVINCGVVEFCNFLGGWFLGCFFYVVFAVDFCFLMCFWFVFGWDEFL